eukprot:15430147-Alexandrium_andersonii.AAC.1
MVRLNAQDSLRQSSSALHMPRQSQAASSSSGSFRQIRAFSECFRAWLETARTCLKPANTAM